MNSQQASVAATIKNLPPALKALLAILWIAAAIAVPARSYFEHPAWDVAIYLHGVDSVRIGHDPYADAIAIQQEFHRNHAEHLNDPTPFSYVYSPITLPVLRLIAISPLWICGIVYWSLYAAGLLGQIWAGLMLSSARERPVFLFLTVVAGFFPGLLASDILWSGNVAFILYGMILLCATIGWRRGDWKWFYIAVLLASCVKAPLLSLLVIAPLTAPRQWLRSTAAAVAGIALFAIQPPIWPSLFRNYLEAVELQFSYNRDFGSSPAGLFSGFLFDHGIPYSPDAYFFFLAYAIPVFILLVWLSRQYFQGRFTLVRWAPVLLVGVLLLNPRILEYDEIMIALPLALILWRFCESLLPTRWAVTLAAAIFFVTNAIAYRGWAVWKLTEGPLLVLFFAAGVWTLLRPSRVRASVRQMTDHASVAIPS